MTNETDYELSILRLLDPVVLAEPSAFYHALRKHDPVHWDPYLNVWVVTGYKQVATVLAELSADRSPNADYLEGLGLSSFLPFFETMKKQMLFMDGHPHTRLRALCAAAFTANKLDRLKSKIKEHAERLLDEVVPLGQAELIRDFAVPLPAIITAELMGVPVDDHQQLGLWINDLVEVHGNFQLHPDKAEQVIKSLKDLESYIDDQMSWLRSHPNDGLICSLMSARIDGEILSDDQIIANTIVMIIGGHETTTNLIASGFYTLLREPSAFEELKSRPELIANAVEELLRYESPVQHTARVANADLMLGGNKIQKGAKVVAVLAATNRDPTIFLEPDVLNFHRGNNRHLAFGWAGHYCFGAPLARLEAEIAFRTLFRRFVEPSLLNLTYEWRENAGLRGLKSLPIRFVPQ